MSYEELEEIRTQASAQVSGSTYAEVVAELSKMSLIQLRFLMKQCKCSISDLTEIVCRGKGIKYDPSSTA
jgi:hypothetical protein